MNHIAILITVLYGVVSLVAIAIAIVVWRSTNSRRTTDTHRLAEREKTWFGVVIGLLAVMLFATIFFTPYGQSAPADHQTVNVTGEQFAWIIQPGTIRRGVPVEFDLRAKDVNHGFAVYDPDGTFDFQVQVVPDALTKLVHTFAKAGTYQVLCYEFCGLDHQNMIGSFQVR